MAVATLPPPAAPVTAVAAVPAPVAPATAAVGPADCPPQASKETVEELNRQLQALQKLLDDQAAARRNTPRLTLEK
jgi:hypothetical protein